MDQPQLMERKMTSASVNYWEPPTDHEARELRRLLEERYDVATQRVSGVVYEAGCGQGFGTSLLAQTPLVAKVIARDMDADAVGIAAQHALPKVSLGVSNLEQDPVPPCDWAVCFEVIEQLHQPEAFLAKVKKAARVGVVLSWSIAGEFRAGQMAELMADWDGSVRTLHERGPGGRILATHELGVFARAA